MAEKLNETRLEQGGTRRRLYPWKQWADGSVWLLKHGTDFSVSVEAMRAAISSHAATMRRAYEAQLPGFSRLEARTSTAGRAEGEIALQFVEVYADGSEHLPTNPFGARLDGSVDSEAAQAKDLHRRSVSGTGTLIQPHTGHAVEQVELPADLPQTPTTPDPGPLTIEALDPDPEPLPVNPDWAALAAVALSDDADPIEGQDFDHQTPAPGPEAPDDVAGFGGGALDARAAMRRRLQGQ